MRVVDEKTGAYSETQAITTHIEPAGMPKTPPHDAAYDAFVALFRDSSTIKSELLACMAK